MSSKHPPKFPKFFGKVQVWMWPHLYWKQFYYFWLKHIIVLSAWNKEWQTDDNSFILPYSFLGWKPSLIKKSSRDTQIQIANSVDVSNGCDPRILSNPCRTVMHTSAAASVINQKANSKIKGWSCTWPGSPESNDLQVSWQSEGFPANTMTHSGFGSWVEQAEHDEHGHSACKALGECGV